MMSPDEALRFLMDTVIAETYDNHSPRDNTPTLPFGSGAEEVFDGGVLAARIRGVIDAAEAGAVTVWRGAAILIGWASTTAHRQFCLGGRSKVRASDKHGCLREVTLAMYLLQYYAPKLHHWIAESAPDCLMAPLDTQAGSDLQGLTDALESELKQGIFPDWNTRELLPVDSRYPIIQIASAITHVSPDTYDEVRRVAVKLQDSLEERDFIVEVPSDYVHVSRRTLVECQEFKTRGGLYQASALIVFADGGGMGTAVTWAIAEECGIPALLLHHPGVDVSAARFGALKNREVAEYSDYESAHEVVFRFLDSKEQGIRARARRLARLRTELDISHLQHRFQTIDPLAFEVSTISYEMAMFMLADPIRWGQARPFVTEEISRVLGFSAGVSSATERTEDRTDLFRAFVGLQNLTEVHALTQAQALDAWQAFLSDVGAKGVSHRDARDWNYDQWLAFLRRRGWSLP